jgi:hypothetical protein
MTPPEKPIHANRRRYVIWLLLCAVIVVFALVIFALQTAPVSPDAIEITFLGFTNINPSPRTFALLSVSNRASYTIHWRGMVEELEGKPGFRGVVENRKAAGYTWYGGKVIKTNLPVTKFDPTFKPGESLSLIIGEPNPDEGQPLPRWRFSMFFCRYTLAERYSDYAMKHKLPLKLGPVLLADSQKFLNPSNNITASSPWLSK